MHCDVFVLKCVQQYSSTFVLRPLGSPHMKILWDTFCPLLQVCMVVLLTLCCFFSCFLSSALVCAPFLDRHFWGWSCGPNCLSHWRAVFVLRAVGVVQVPLTTVWTHFRLRWLSSVLCLGGTAAHILEGASYLGLFIQGFIWVHHFRECLNFGSAQSSRSPSKDSWATFVIVH